MLTAFRVLLYPLDELFFRNDHAAADAQSGKIFFVHQLVCTGRRNAQSLCHRI